MPITQGTENFLDIIPNHTPKKKQKLSISSFKRTSFGIEQFFYER
jgi:hypothetical protein